MTLNGMTIDIKYGHRSEFRKFLSDLLSADSWVSTTRFPPEGGRAFIRFRFDSSVTEEEKMKITAWMLKNI